MFSHLRWGFVWQRPQQLLSRLAKTHPVLFFEEPDYRLSEEDEPVLVLEDTMPNVTVAQVLLPPSFRGTAKRDEIMLEFTRAAVDALNVDGKFDRPLLWYYSPMEAAWSLGKIEGSGVVYDCMDELSQFRGAPTELVANEDKLIGEADIVFTGGYELWKKKSKQHGNVHFFGCGVEYDHFAQAQDPQTPIPAELKKLRRPIIGWFGVVDERVDYDLLRAAAALRPKWSFVLVGPVVKVDPSELPQAPNLHWLGGRPYADLPSYCRAFDACMMCFALNEATEFINPTKALEYLATGKPVISTPVRDVVRQYGDEVLLADDAESFVKAAETAIRKPDKARIEQGITRAQEASWDGVVSKMEALIERSICAKNPAANVS